jgi:methionine-rich copper-binding protein CopC
LVAFTGDAHAKGSYLTSFIAKYPSAAGSKLDSCNVCHGSGGTSTWNSYGQAVKSATGADITARITAVAGQDSDGDGFTNQVEIAALTLPGDAADKPASGGTPPPPPPPAGDTTPPAVSSTGPARSAASVPVTTNVTATFDEAINSSTLTTATFTLNGGAGGVAGTVSLSGNTATFRPSASLAYSTAYTATITTGVKDLAGNALAANYTWTFTTGAAADTTPPAVSSTSPANGAAGVAANASITATFSEAVEPATVTSTTFTLQGGAAVVGGTVSLNGNTATFRPQASLAPGTTYTATIATGVRDLAGNAMAASRSWTFTTGSAADTTPPTVSSTGPASNQSGVAVSATVTATFSEAVDTSTVTPASFTLKNGGNGVAGTVSLSGTTATFAPSAPLANGTAYTATVTTAVKDLAGNPMAANRSWTFTTGAAADTTPPAVSSTDPSSNEAGVQVNASVTATFSEAINPATVTPNTFVLSDGVNQVIGSVSVNGATATFTPAAPLFDGTTYTATITTAVKDLAGNALPAVHSTTFSTVAAADTAPPAPTGASGDVAGGGCAMAAGSRGDIRDLAGAYGLLILSALGIAIRGRMKKGKS